ncbi:MAG: response regulator [Cyanobacteria bacterium SIG30]|nr:response regulator [Cyanobacteria bacterium SIG30]
MSTFNRMVIVDDEPMVLKTLKMLLNLEGFSDVHCFDNPEDALDFLAKNETSLILSDFIMPEMNGLEFLSKAKEVAPNATQIILTGYADKENAIKAINELGIYKYIEKPWDNSELVINIKNGLERAHLKEQVAQKIRELEELNESLEETVKERTKELHQTNVKLRTIIEDCADGIAIFDVNYEILLVNNALKNMFGMNDEDILLKNFFEMVINEKNQKFQDSLRERNTIYLRDFSIVNFKKEKKIPVEINISSVFDDENNFYIASIRDVSYQVENENLRNDFIATLTHDLRTPLLAAISGLDFMLNKTLGDLNEKQNVMLDTMKRSNQDMLGLVNALLEVYRYESGNLFLTKTQFCLNSLVKECKDELLPLLNENNIDIDLNLINEDNSFEINADKREIKRVIMNLIGNAIKHSNSNSKIIVSVRVDDKDVTLSVRDFGCGLDDSDCKKLFKRFSQGTSRKRACSTGLGLYLSRQIVEAHNGRIWVESEVDKGSIFSFTLKGAITENRVLL